MLHASRTYLIFIIATGRAIGLALVSDYPKKEMDMMLRFIYRHPFLRAVYWYIRSPFSPYAAYCWYKEKLARRLRTRGEYRVIFGPFAGMVYTRHGSSIGLPMLLGTYELEVWPLLDKIKDTNYATIIDVGCAEGYYACGLARMFKKPVLAYDVLKNARMDCLEMARANGLGAAISVRGLLTHQELQALCSASRSLIFCDIDGGETDLLDPDKVPALAYADMLVEIHGSVADNTFNHLEPRFRETHTITVIDRQPRFAHEIHDRFFKNGRFELNGIVDEPLAEAFNEPRGFNKWALFRSVSALAEVRRA